MDTTKLDDLLNQAEAQESDQSQWIEDINYITKNFYVDEHGVVEVKNKSIGDMSKHISVKGESYSQYIEFKIGRFFDGIDLTKMKLAIYFSIPGVGEDESVPINVYYNENEIKFGWVIPPEVAQKNLAIEFCIYARGKLSDGNDYILKTKTATYQINDGLEIGNLIIKPTNNWYLNFVLEMDEKVSQATESADRAEQAVSSLDGVVETVTTARDEVVQKASTVDTQHSEVESWHQEAEQFRNEAEQFRDQAEAITGIGLAEEGKPGIVQPDGVTTKVDENGKLIVIGGGSGGGGTTDYQALENKPSIAGVELNGDKSYDELGIASKEAVARNFETVNQSIKELDDYTQSLGEDIVSLDTELQTTSEKLVSVENELQKTTTKVDTIIEKADLGIKETASGEEIHLTDSADGKAVEYSLYGKAKQNTTSGKNLINVDAEQGYPSNTATSNATARFFDDDTYILGIAQNNYYTSSNAKDYKKIDNGFSISMKQGYGVGFVIKDIEESQKYTLTFDVSPAMTTNMVNLACYDENGNYIQGENLSNTTLEHYERTFTIPQGTKRCLVVIASNTPSTTEYETFTFKNVQFEKNTVATHWEEFTGEMASPNPDYPQEIEVSGESYNLLENTATSQTINGVEFVVNEDKSISVKGTATANAVMDLPITLIDGITYKASGITGGSESTYQVYLQTADGLMNSVGFFVDGEKIFTKDNNSYNVGMYRIRVLSGATVDTTIYPMIRKASVKNDRYMPYGKDSVEVKSVGKNLFDKNAPFLGGENFDDNGNQITSGSSDWGIHNQYIKVMPLADYIVSGGVVPTNWNLRVAFYDINKNPILMKSYKNSTGVISINIPQNIYYVRFKININGSKKDTIQMEKGIIATPYEEYKETLATIPTPNGLAGIKVSDGGNYTDQNGQQWICDEIVKYADGSGAYIQRIGKAVYDGSSDEEWLDRIDAYTEKVNNQKRFVISNNNYNFKYNVPCISNIGYKGTIDATYAYSPNGLCHYYQTQANRGYTYITLIDENITDLTTFKSWLASNPVTEFYEIKQPLHTPLTAEELAEIEKLQTFYPVTNISNDADCGMKIEYVGDSIITTNTEIPIVEPFEEEELEDGDNIVTLFGKIKKLLKNVGKGVVDVVDNLLSTSATSSLSANQGRVLDGKITVLNNSLNDISNLINEQLVKQISDISTRLSTLEQNQKIIVYSDTEPETVEENTIVMVYETEE